MLIWLGALAVAVALLGCGGDDEDSGVLVRYEVQGGNIDFSFGEPQDSVVPIPDALLVVQPDGEATYGFNNRREFTLRLSDADLSKLQTAIDDIWTASTLRA